MAFRSGDPHPEDLCLLLKTEMTIYKLLGNPVLPAVLAALPASYGCKMKNLQAIKENSVLCDPFAYQLSEWELFCWLLLSSDGAVWGAAGLG